jgi:hypothetical protein
MIKPSIVEAIGERVELRKAGKEYIGLCPFHDDKTPSFCVNDDKAVFYCHGCGSKGDIIDFIQKLDGVSFRQALATLGMNHKDAIRHRATNDPVKTIAAEMSRWADTQTDRANYLLREIGQRLQLAQKISWTAEEKISSREYAILSVLADDLQTAKLIIELYENRAQMEALLADADLDETEKFPSLTDGYRAYLQANLPKAQG